MELFVHLYEEVKCFEEVEVVGVMVSCEYPPHPYHLQPSRIHAAPHLWWNCWSLRPWLGHYSRYCYLIPTKMANGQAGGLLKSPVLMRATRWLLSLVFEQFLHSPYQSFHYQTCYCGEQVMNHSYRREPVGNCERCYLLRAAPTPGPRMLQLPLDLSVPDSLPSRGEVVPELVAAEASRTAWYRVETGRQGHWCGCRYSPWLPGVLKELSSMLSIC